MENLAVPASGTEAPGVRAADPHTDARLNDEVAARRMFSTAIMVSGLRCLVTYILLPFVAPAVGLASGAGPGLGIVIGTVAIGANILTIRRFQVGRHRWRWAITSIAACVIVLLVVLLVRDIGALV